MALIKCPDCGKMFSEYAKCCPECGCPVNVAKRDFQTGEEYEDYQRHPQVVNNDESVTDLLEGSIEGSPSYNVSRKPWQWISIASCVAILIIGGLYYWFSNNKSVVTDVSLLSEKESLKVIKSLAKVMDKYDNSEWWMMGEFHDGLATVIRDSKKGFINVWGEEIVPCKYTIVGDFSEGLAMILRNDLFGYVNTEGKEVIPPKYKLLEHETIPISPFSEGLAFVRTEEGCGFIDKQGKMVIPWVIPWQRSSDFIGTTGFHGDVAMVSDNELWIINKKGEFIFTLDGYHERGFSNGLLKCSDLHGKERYYDTSGKEVFPQTPEKLVPPGKYKYIRDDFSEGMALVSPDYWKYGYINTKGEEVIPCIYDSGSDEYGYDCSPSDFSEGLAVVCQNDKWGYIDKQGNIVIPLKYDGAHSFKNGLARVRLNDKWGYIDKYGHCTLDYQ